MYKRKLVFTGLVVALTLGGCTLVPNKIQVTDTGSGRVYETYDDPYWSKENMLGYNFVDISSGSTIMLKAYEKKLISRGGFSDRASPAALEYQRDRERAGH